RRDVLGPYRPGRRGLRLRLSAGRREDPRTGNPLSACGGAASYVPYGIGRPPTSSARLLVPFPSCPSCADACWIHDKVGLVSRWVGAFDWGSRICAWVWLSLWRRSRYRRRSPPIFRHGRVRLSRSIFGPDFTPA